MGTRFSLRLRRLFEINDCITFFLLLRENICSEAILMNTKNKYFRTEIRKILTFVIRKVSFLRKVSLLLTLLRGMHYAYVC